MFHEHDWTDDKNLWFMIHVRMVLPRVFLLKKCKILSLDSSSDKFVPGSTLICKAISLLNKKKCKIFILK